MTIAYLAIYRDKIPLAHACNIPGTFDLDAPQIFDLYYKTNENRIFYNQYNWFIRLLINGFFLICAISSGEYHEEYFSMLNQLQIRIPKFYQTESQSYIPYSMQTIYGPYLADIVKNTQNLILYRQNAQQKAKADEKENKKTEECYSTDAMGEPLSQENEIPNKFAEHLEIPVKSNKFYKMFGSFFIIVVFYFLLDFILHSSPRNGASWSPNKFRGHWLPLALEPVTKKIKVQVL